jgi:hypothetical protein
MNNSPDRSDNDYRRQRHEQIIRFDVTTRNIHSLDDVKDMHVKPYHYPRRKQQHAYRSCTDDALVESPLDRTSFSQAKSSPIDCLKEINKTVHTFQRHLVEVGIDMIPMAGIDETSHAHRLGNTIDTVCIQCATVLFGIQSASMIICPACRCVSPIEIDATKKVLPTTDVHAGIGLTIDFVFGL